MHEQHRLDVGRDGLGGAARVDLHRGRVGFDEHGAQPAFGDGEDGGDISVGRHEHAVAAPEAARLDEGAEDEDQRVESVGASHGVWRADICGELALEGGEFLTLQIPSRGDRAAHGLVNLGAMERGHFP